MSVLTTFKEFLSDDSFDEMYVTGPAGTGKTTKLHESIQYCIDNGIEYVCCAHTHKACGILRSKLPEDAVVVTLHKFLRKIPSINQDAKHVKHLNTNYQIDIPKRPRVVFIDEFSMVGESDLVSLREIQDPEDEDEPGAYTVKLVWIGDMNQLPPVQDMQTVKPHGKYWVKLTHIYRQALDNPLTQVLKQLVSFIEGDKSPVPLVESDNFIRGVHDLTDLYSSCMTDKVLLCYTNKQVQFYNSAIQGYSEPRIGDVLFCGNNHQIYQLIEELPAAIVQEVNQHNGILELGSKYKTLEYLKSSGLCKFYLVRDEDAEEYIFPVIFGTSNYREAIKEYSAEATKANKVIENKHNPDSVSGWARLNYTTPEARVRAKAWRKLLSVRNNIFCMDFNHAMTVHKSQGSTYTTVFIDTQDLGQCANTNYDLYLRLLYVAISRASNTVITN